MREYGGDRVDSALQRLVSTLDAILRRHQVRLALAREGQAALDVIRREAFRRAEPPKRGWWPWSRSAVVELSREDELRQAMSHRIRCEDLALRLEVAREGLRTDQATLAVVVEEAREAKRSLAAQCTSPSITSEVAASATAVGVLARAMTSLELMLPEATGVLEELHRTAVALVGVLREAESALAAAPETGGRDRLARLVANVHQEVERVVRAPGERGAIDPDAIDALAVAFEPVRPVCEQAVRAEQEVVQTLKGRTMDEILARARQELSPTGHDES